MSVVFQILLAVSIVSILSLVGVVFLACKEKLLKKILMYLIALSVGVLFADAFLHILPQVYEYDQEIAHQEEEHDEYREENKEHEVIHEEEQALSIIHDESNTADLAMSKHDHSGGLGSSVWILVGIVLFFFVEKFLHRRHCHHLPSDKHPHPVAFINLIGDGMHNFLDGMLIAGSFLVDPTVGIATTIAVIFHEIPQEIGDFATLVHAGFSTQKALLTNLLSGILAVIGAGIVLLVHEAIAIEHILLPLTAGSFIYLAGSDLIPILNKKNSLKEGLFQLLFILIGIGLMVGVIFLEH